MKITGFKNFFFLKPWLTFVTSQIPILCHNAPMFCDYLHFTFIFSSERYLLENSIAETYQWTRKKRCQTKPRPDFALKKCRVNSGKGKKWNFCFLSVADFKSKTRMRIINKLLCFLHSCKYIRIKKSDRSRFFFLTSLFYYYFDRYNNLSKMAIQIYIISNSASFF